MLSPLDMVGTEELSGDNEANGLDPSDELHPFGCHLAKDCALESRIVTNDVMPTAWTSSIHHLIANCMQRCAKYPNGRGSLLQPAANLAISSGSNA
jgi:hypothetical protein